jgi:hypothetical protein
VRVIVSRWIRGIITRCFIGIGTAEPVWDHARYAPSTFLGARTPQCFLKAGKTSIVDLYAKEWTLVEFTSTPNTTTAIPVPTKFTADLDISLTPLHIQDEDHVRKMGTRCGAQSTGWGRRVERHS